MQEGFVMIPRSFFKSGYWRQSRTYNDCEAILDIMQQVRFEASEQFARIGGREVRWGQGEWPASVRFLAERWEWTERRVRTFIASLKRNGVITTDDSQGLNVIKLIGFAQNEKSDTANDTASDTTLRLTINELQALVTQQVTQCLTQQRHSSDTNTNKGNNIKKDSSLRSESTHDNSACAKFNDWLETECPYIFKHYKLLTDAEFDKLKIEYGSHAIAEECMNIENRVDLRKKYSNLYRTLLNWLKRHGNGKIKTDNGTYQANTDHPSDNELVAGAAELISSLAEKRRNGC